MCTRPNQYPLRFWSGLRLPEPVKTQQAPGWQSGPTVPPPPALRQRHCQVISHSTTPLEKQRDFTAVCRGDTAARAEVEPKSNRTHSPFHISCRLTYYADSFSGLCPLLEHIDLQGGVQKLVIIMISFISTQPLNFHRSKYPRATGILGVSEHIVPRW